jgi:putative nucleotidyltransferase with HDIG domain
MKMAGDAPGRDKAFLLLKEYLKTDNLIRHSLAVEAVMRHLAAKAGEDVELWGLAGLLHDIDYEKYPTEHCAHAPKIIRENGFPEEVARAVESHGYGIFNEVEPLTKMEKTLYAIDELTGLVAAAALVRPSRSVLDIEPKSVKKKWKDKAFAAGVDRSIIEKGAAMLGIEISDLISDAIEGMKPAAEAIGLKGNL